MHWATVAQSRSQNTTPSPRSPRPVTQSPITAPDLKATFRALLIPLSSAAHAVLTLPLVATLIPKNPASTDRSAPITYRIAVVQLTPNPIARKSITITIIIVLYSLFRNAIAPSLMNPDISFILSLPSFALLIQLVRPTATRSPIIAATGMRILRTSIVLLLINDYLPSRYRTKKTLEASFLRTKVNIIKISISINISSVSLYHHSSVTMTSESTINNIAAIVDTLLSNAS